MEQLTRFKKIAKRRYRESFGLFYEEFVIGSTIEHRPGRTITSADNMLQSMLSMNPHPLHINQHYAAQTEFSQIVVSSLVTFSFVNSFTVASISGNAIANLSWEKVELLSPVFIGDTIYAESTILKKRRCQSRDNTGIVTVATVGLKSNGEKFMQFQRSFMVPTSES